MITKTTGTLALALALPFAAVCAKDVEAIQPVYDPDGVQWHASAAFAGARLTISGPGGFYFTRSFAKGDSLYLDYMELADSYLPNGYYTYELVLSPSVSAADKALATAARQLGETADLFGTASMGYTSGGFRVSDGTVIDRDLPESTLKDQVFFDDVIAVGSLCVGQDCSNGESFGFDTIRLKENNLRIKFQDTSNSASFPSNDWQITINDSTNGGANKFSIDDIDGGRTPFTIEASAPSHSLYVDDGGRMGLGTNSPVVDMHMRSGNTPTMRLEQDGSSGFQSQVFDISGNETNFFIRDVTNGSKLPFRIKPNSPTDSLFIAADGDIGVGTDSPDSGSGADLITEIRRTNGSTSLTLDYNGASKFGEVTFEEGNSPMWSVGASSNSDFFYVFNYGRGSSDMTVENSNGNLGLGGVTAATNPIEHSNGAVLTAGGTWQNASSRSLKTNIRTLSATAATAALNELEPVSYRYIADPDDEVLGFVAEDVPDLVATQSRKTLSSMDIIAVLTKVVQDQQNKIESLEKAVADLQRSNQD